MIRLTVFTDGHGVLTGAEVAGHALGLQKGGNIVCAAVTVLVRTAARLLEAEEGVGITGGPGPRGEFAFEIEGVERSKIEFVKTTGSYLMQGIRDLQKEFPDDCTLKVMQRR